MKTLIINGSPRKNGDTAALIDAFAGALDGEVKIVSCFDNISPCRDCRWRREHSGCVIQDDMQAVYHFLEECDNVVLASPVWFSSLSGPTLNICSRFQTLFAARCFRGESREADKNGVLMLVGAEPGTEEVPARNALTIMKHMGARRPCVAEIYSMNAENVPARKGAVSLDRAHEAARMLNEMNRA